MKLAIYPGSFDPLTNGHLDIILRANGLFDQLIVAIGINPNKKSLFTVEERTDMIQQVLQEEKLTNTVRVESFEGLLADYTAITQADAIVRGLRAVSDFEYEFAFSSMNRALKCKAEAIYLMANEKYTTLSSKLAKEIISLGGDLRHLVPKGIYERMIDRFQQG